MREDDPMIRVEMTADANVDITMFTGYSDSDVELTARLSTSGARRLAILLLEESERADTLWERLKNDS